MILGYQVITQFIDNLVPIIINLRITLFASGPNNYWDKQ